MTSCELLSPLLLVGVLPWQWLVWVCPGCFPPLVSMPTQVDHCREGRQLSPAAPPTNPLVGYHPLQPCSGRCSLITQLESRHFLQAWIKYSFFYTAAFKSSQINPSAALIALQDQIISINIGHIKSIIKVPFFQ